MANFRPALGTIGNYREPGGYGVRVDSGVRAGYTVPRFYDSLLAKLIVWAEDRAEAIARMQRALADYQIDGVITTIPFHRAALAHPVFASGEATVNFIAQHPELIEATRAFSGALNPAEATGENGEARDFTVEVNSRRFSVRVFGVPVANKLGGATSNRRATSARGSAAQGPKVDGVISPLQGRLAAIRVAPGDQVAAGQVLFIVEAMKMENEITAPHDGTLGEIHVAAGVTVEAGALLATYQ